MFFQQPMCGGVAVLDYDHDGLMDIFFTNAAKKPELRSQPVVLQAISEHRGAAFQDNGSVLALQRKAAENIPALVESLCFDWRLR